MNDVESILEKALDLGEEGDYQGMAELLRGSLEEHADDPFLLCWLGVAERELGMDGVAHERFKRCLAQEPQDPYVLATAGNAIADFDDPEAEAALRTAAMTAPGLALARWMYGAYLAREGLLADALEHLDAARRLAPGDPTVALERGIALALDGRLQEAADELGRAATLDMEDGWVRILLGLTLAELGDLEDAATEVEGGARLRPEDVEAQLLAALLLGITGWDDRAFEMVERARQRGQGGDLEVVARVEDVLGEGPEAARRLLHSTLLPGAYRDRLMARP